MQKVAVTTANLTPVGSFAPAQSAFGLRRWQMLFATSQVAQIPSGSSPPLQGGEGESCYAIGRRWRRVIGHHAADRVRVPVHRAELQKQFPKWWRFRAGNREQTGRFAPPFRKSPSRYFISDGATFRRHPVLRVPRGRGWRVQAPPAPGLSRRNKP